MIGQLSQSSVTESPSTYLLSIVLPHALYILLGCDNSDDKTRFVDSIYKPPHLSEPRTPQNPFHCLTFRISVMSTFMAPVAKPTSRLARYRALSPHASIHVSPLQLGGMSIGDKWEKYGYGSMNKESSFELLDAFYDAGGNFIDTANV